MTTLQAMNAYPSWISHERACELEELQKGPTRTLWSIVDFDMLLTQWALPQVFIVSFQNNASCGCRGNDEEIEIFGAFQNAAEARAAVDSKKKHVAKVLLDGCDESEEEDVPSPPTDFLSTLLIPDKQVTENWHPDGTGCVSFHVRSDGCACAIDRVSLRVQKVPNVPASKPMKLLALVKSFRDTLLWLQLCNLQGLPLFSFVQVSPCVSHTFAGTRVIDNLTHAERLRVLGCGFKGELVRLLSLGMSRQCEPQRNSGASRKMMQRIARRVAAGLAATVHSKSKSKSKPKKRARRDLPWIFGCFKYTHLVWFLSLSRRCHTNKYSTQTIKQPQQQPLHDNMT
jgi:hypothetical protein